MRWPWIAALLLTLACPDASAQTWPIDAERASASFSVRPLWLKRIEGHFPVVEGVLVRDPERDTLSVDVRIDARALQMTRGSWLTWAQSEEFFDVERHPWIRFRSLPFAAHRLREGGTIEGQATLRGVTRPIRFQLAPATCPAPGSACPLHAEGEVNRSLFGMDAHRVALGDRVRLSFSVMLDPASDQGTLP